MEWNYTFFITGFQIYNYILKAKGKYSRVNFFDFNQQCNK